MVSNFNKQKDQKYAESIAKEIVKQNGYQGIKDVSRDEKWQAVDVDFIAIPDLKFEVKNDDRMHETGNIFVELTKIYKDDETDGWFNVTQADLLIYRCAQQKLNFIFAVESLREYLETYKCNNMIIKDFDEKTGKFIKNVWGKLVPFKHFAEVCEVYCFTDNIKKADINTFKPKNTYVPEKREGK